jgi:hypothetical protein
MMIATTAAVRANMPLGTNFWAIPWHDAKDVFADGRDNVTGENPWNPQFLKELKPYTVLRFMDWDRINKSPRVKFSERRQKSDPKQTPEVAYEWMIDLCNRLDADMWVCIPAQAEWDYSRELAELIKKELKPTLKVYVEYSNETWNGSFNQTQYCIDQGSKLNLPGQGMKPGENKHYLGWAYHVYAAVRHFENFERVFAGDDRSRLVKVLAGQTGNSAVVNHHLACLRDKTVNPNGITIDAYAVAPYFGHKVSGNDPEVFTKLRQDIDQRVVPNVKRHSDILRPLGIKLIAYEGGQHVLDASVVPNRDQRMYDTYIYYLDQMDDYMEGVFSHYVHVGTGPPRQMWGAMDITGQDPANAPKYRALVDYAARNSSR